MAYALIAWRRDGGDEEKVETVLKEVGAIPFFKGLFLVPEDGPSWSDVKAKVQEAVEANPGTQAVIIMPAKGSRVGGWVDTAPPPDQLEKARKIMNRSGSNVVPVLFATPDEEG